MGMAASQARFLQLTARKTNLEYMGQQINQERLALANQSAGLFERQLTLEPPVPPSSLNDEYYTPGYNFTDAADGLKKNITWVDLNGPTQALDVAGTWVDPDGTSGAITAVISEANLLLCVDGETRISDGTGGGGAAFAGIEVDAQLENLMGDNAGAGLNLAPQADTVKIITRYVTIEHDVYLPDGSHSTVQRSTPAILEFDNLNRLINMTPLDDVEYTGTSALANGAAYATLAAARTGLTAETYSGQLVGAGGEITYSPVFDEAAFNDDMNEYEYKKATYDYEIERINLETKQIQEQDRSLELKMKQIDTEHKAISTEMDAVQKVIQKSIESSFKTFS